MTFKLPPLPYSTDALAPFISKETLEFHYGKHHQNYVTTLNKLLEKEPEFQRKELEEIIRNSSGPLFNNAAQTWNHTFYWHCMAPAGEKEPGGSLRETLQKNFGSFEAFKNEFSQQSLSLFGSGWTWLVKDQEGKLSILQTKDGDNPLTHHLQPLLTCDVWEHAYYIDYRNQRIKYLEAFWNVIHWDFVESQLQGTHSFVPVSHC